MYYTRQSADARAMAQEGRLARFSTLKEPGLLRVTKCEAIPGLVRGAGTYGKVASPIECLAGDR
jgi:hypothetical protein